MHEMEHTAQRVVGIGRGRLIDALDVAELRGRAAAVRVRPADDATTALLARVLGDAGATVVGTPEGLDARGVPADRIGRIALEHGIALRELAQRTSGLEESFLALTAREEESE
jgi:ABC-2 type transport system ATP-binding protein